MDHCNSSIILHGALNVAKNSRSIILSLRIKQSCPFNPQLNLVLADGRQNTRDGIAFGPSGLFR